MGAGERYSVSGLPRSNWMGPELGAPHGETKNASVSNKVLAAVSTGEKQKKETGPMPVRGQCAGFFDKAILILIEIKQNYET